MSIRALAELSLADRCERILSRGRDDLRAALSLARQQGLDPGWVSLDDPERNLAWAVAWSLAPDPASDLDHPDKTSKRIFGCDQAPNDPFVDRWDRMIRPHPLRDPPEETTCLCDLAWSVACERRTDWHLPGNRRVTDAEAAFRCLWDRYDRPVRNVVRSKYTSVPELDIDSCVNEAWAQVYATYWLDTARRRFLGRSPVKNFIITVSTNCVERERRRVERERRRGCAAPPPVPGPFHDGQAPDGAVAALLHSAEHRAAIMRCLATLPAGQALYAYCRLLLGFRPKAIAAAWATSQANVAQQLAEAWPRLRECPHISDALSIIEATAWEERVDRTDLH